MIWADRIADHYDKVWDRPATHCKFEKGPIDELGSTFQIRKYPPTADRNMWTFVTCGMSRAYDATPVELHIFSPVDSPEIVELLVVTAHYHRTSEPLDLWHTVNFGRPWLQGSTCSHGLVSLPYLDGPALENLPFQNNSIKFYWLIPISYAEVQYKVERGIDALETAFEIAKLNYIDVMRGSVV